MATDQSTSSPLRVGVVGLGVGRFHLRAYRQIPELQVVALADLDPERLSAMGKEYDVPNLYGDYKELVARDDLNIVTVCTPNYLHAPVAIAALESGKHVLCEKPLARTAAEAETIVRAAIEAGRVLQVVFNHRERGDVAALKRYIAEGGLGRVYHTKANWLRRNGIPGLGSWFTKRDMAGGGPLIDLGVHILDMALYLLGEPKVLTVSAVTHAELGPRGRGSSGWNKMIVSEGYEVEDLASALMRLEGGATLLLETSWATYRPQNDEFGVTLYGADGGAEIKVTDSVGEDTLEIYTDVAGVPSDIHPHVSKGEGHVAVARKFVDIIKSGDWSAHVGRAGLYRTQIIDACYKSAREGREVSL